MPWTGKKWTPLILIGGIYMALYCMKSQSALQGLVEDFVMLQVAAVTVINLV